MASVKIRTGAVLGVLAGLTLTSLSALAEGGRNVPVVQLAASRAIQPPVLSATTLQTPLVQSMIAHSDAVPAAASPEVSPAATAAASCMQPDAGTLRAIVPVATDHGSYATGVVYDTNRVLTAAHALQGGGQFFVRVGDSFRAADLVVIDHVNDLAVLAVDTQAIKPLHISGFDPADSQPVWAVGYPRAQAIMTSTGVLQYSREGSLHASASIDSGQSGGGLLSCHEGAWEMLGMLRGYGAYLKGDRYVKLPNHSVSVAAATINRFLLTYH